jgi:hypothetical protein
VAATVLNALPGGSYLMLSHVTADFTPAMNALIDTYHLRRHRPSARAAPGSA